MEDGRDKPLLDPEFSLEVCPMTPAHPRHDHQLIFPLKDRSLLLVWSEYYANRPQAVRPSVPGLAPSEVEVGDDFPCRISGKLSEDGGRSWSDSFTMQENVWGKNVKHPNMLRGANGDILFTFTAWESEQQRNIFLKRSPDDGETWSEPVPLSDPGWYCTNNDHAIRLSSDRILLPGHGGPGFEFHPENPLHSFVFISDNDGHDWRLSRNTMTAPGRGAHEPTLVELRDGRLLCFLRTNQQCIYKSFSSDGGETWTEPVPTSLEAPDSPPLLKRVPGSDNLLCVWNQVASSWGNPRSPLTLALSRDEGETWDSFTDIDARPEYNSAYAAVFFHGEETLITYYSSLRDGPRNGAVILKIVPTDLFRK